MSLPMRRWLLPALTLMIGGCLYIPTPEFKSGTFATRDPIGPLTVKSFEPGVATRADVMLILGEPDAVVEGERYLIYRWEMTSGIIVVGGGYNAAAAEIPRTHFLIMEFDEQGVYLRSKFIADELLQTASVERAIKEW